MKIVKTKQFLINEKLSSINVSKYGFLSIHYYGTYSISHLYYRPVICIKYKRNIPGLFGAITYTTEKPILYQTRTDTFSGWTIFDNSLPTPLIEEIEKVLDIEVTMYL